MENKELSKFVKCILASIGYNMQSFRNAIKAFLNDRAKGDNWVAGKPTRVFINLINKSRYSMTQDEYDSIMEWYDNILDQFDVVYDRVTGYHTYPAKQSPQQVTVSTPTKPEITFEKYVYYLKATQNSLAIPDNIEVRCKSLEEAIERARTLAKQLGFTISLVRTE